jgi:hypothetical protein
MNFGVIANQLFYGSMKVYLITLEAMIFYITVACFSYRLSA